MEGGGSVPLTFYSGQQPDYLAASVVDYYSGVLKEVLELVASAIELAKNERTEILASDDAFEMSDIILHRWANRDGSQLCAISALSKKLGYRPAQHR
jgi:hypothetical protein